MFNLISETGLQMYKFGRTASIPFPDKSYEPETAYDILKENKRIDAHTLLLLDIKTDEEKYMTVSEAISILLKIELKRNEKVFTSNTLCVACASLGSDKQKIKAGNAKDLMKEKFVGMQCLIIPAKLHFVEEEFLKQFC